MEAEIYVMTLIKNNNNKQVQWKVGLFSYLAIAAAQNDSFPEDHRYSQAL